VVEAYRAPARVGASGDRKYFRGRCAVRAAPSFPAATAVRASLPSRQFSRNSEISRRGNPEGQAPPQGVVHRNLDSKRPANGTNALIDYQILIAAPRILVPSLIRTHWNHSAGYVLPLRR
jgi:hypothetical protein